MTMIKSLLGRMGVHWGEEGDFFSCLGKNDFRVLKTKDTYLSIDNTNNMKHLWKKIARFVEHYSRSAMINR